MTHHHRHTATASTGGGDLTPAGPLRHCGAICYDLLVVIAILFIATIFWTAAGVTFGHPWYGAYVTFVYLTVFLYFAWCWIHGGQTVGMKVWKIGLVGTGAKRFGWTSAMARTAMAMISAALLGAGFWWMRFDRDGLSWHDRFSDSRLIRTAPPSNKRHH